MKISIEVAKALEYLHERKYVHCDIKASNILLSETFDAKARPLINKALESGNYNDLADPRLKDYGYGEEIAKMVDCAAACLHGLPGRRPSMRRFLDFAPLYAFKFKKSALRCLGHLTSKSDVYSFGVVLLEMLTGRRSMDKNRPNGEHNLVEWARPNLGERRRFYRIIDPRLEGHFSIKDAQKAAQLAARCLSRDPKVRPLMSEVVDVLKPLPNLKDMATSSYYFQTMQPDRVGSSPNGKNGFRTHGSFSRIGQNGQQQQQHPRSLSIPNGSHASPYHQFAHNSPKPNVKP
ncbi:hypothetical protein ACJIZ3_020201 [Penstemon smallii]|uniref:non-specific serine/threonine protein kinase n=1 Tax=Penstemon smallii TaxID=265156 RepID=A0ABD3SI69_9LAMI